MDKIKIGILRETTKSDDRRVPLTPRQCFELQQDYPNVEVYVQPCSIRCYDDHDYKAFGIPLQEDVSGCDILLGIKEVAVDKLIDGKTYLFFSHTMKKQERNRGLLKAMLDKKVRMVDYECLTDEERNRVIGFGRYAGIIGAYNGILGYGQKYDLFDIKRAFECRDHNDMEDELKRVKLTNIKICLTGGGRVANGATETLGMLKIRKVTPYEFLNCSYREPVYVQLHSKDYNRPKDGSGWDSDEFYTHPEEYDSMFYPYTKVTDLLITCHYWHPQAPALFTKQDMRKPDFRVSVIADVTCDIDGSVPSTLRASTIEEPFYGYNPVTEQLDEPFIKDTITVMAVDNLPCELPRDASEDFGKSLVERVFPALLGHKDPTGMIARATITKDGKLTDRFNYLGDWVGA
jgi:saccharopine dehydrogenase (NAD+, L-lysine-forming)